MRTQSFRWWAIQRAIVRNAWGRLARKPILDPSEIDLRVGKLFWYSFFTAGLLPICLTILAVIFARPPEGSARVLVLLVTFSVVSLISDSMWFLFSSEELTTKAKWGVHRICLLYFPVASCLLTALWDICITWEQNLPVSLFDIAGKSLFALTEFYLLGAIGIAVVTAKRKFFPARPG
jgi:hypothetical protein